MNIHYKSVSHFIFASALLSASVCFADSYTFQTLNDQADPTFNQLLGINNSGTIVGYFGVGSNTNPNKGYVLAPPYGQANYTNENFPASAQTQVVGINNAASPTTVGFWVDGAGNNFGFVRQTTGVYTSVQNPNTPSAGQPVVNQLLGVNNGGVAVGFYTDGNGNNQAYSYSISQQKFNGLMLPSNFGAVSTTATGINSSGVITGFYVDGNDVTHGFLDNNGVFSSFDDPAAAGNTMFLGINNKDQIAGSFADQNGTTNGLVYDFLTNSWMLVNDPNASPVPALGDVTGTTINGINDLGQLVGFYSDGNNVDGFLATPRAVTATPEPASLGLMGASLLALGCLMRKRVRRNA